ncbi:MAG: hypothetical protein MSA90_04600 [Faecalicatena sp.]|uniref:hypothetical protein n=1 Tax=Faecalicatena sp. TaxID=2005360 RepID=UPI0025877CD8|nr:hypothetical protein [Faecalicatena sp.]MCI6464730.1 hypothetical protein [Faecalicatena sp.]MDY5618308.1 hypothetical protein [Lachnospiraceae bacterium]
MYSESINGYDEWKTTPPNDPDSSEICSSCGRELYEGDYIYDVGNECICEECLNNQYRRMI